jgi:hypothetical protein
MARLSQAGAEWLGRQWLGYGAARHGRDWQGKAGKAWHGEDWQGMAGEARLGSAWPGRAWLGRHGFYKHLKHTHNDYLQISQQHTFNWR